MTTFMTSRMGRLRLPSLCFVTDRKVCGDKPLEDVVSQAIDGGANVVQLREKDLSAGELFALGVRLREVTKNRSLLLINDRLDIVQACGADGAQLPEKGLPTSVARWVLGRHALLGRSVHSVEAAQQAESDGADMVIVGPVFETSSKPKATPVGMALIKEIAESVPLPVIAIGGITPENAGEVIRAGAAGVAVISAICGADDPRAAAEALTQAMGEAWRDRLMERAKAGA
ncbi:MAG: thiamine phosphate synthase [Dehalococcoidia bacterium]|jgi:thiamine-phosphate pyrophosphorylase|nr:thiamine phosphate synthase [Dehalococcoidia bacterium]